MYNLVDLSDKKIIITGASSGIGRETAVILSKLGAQLILVARRKNELEETLGMLEEGREHCYFEKDLSKVDEIEELVKCIVEKVGPLDGLAYCAGITGDYPIKYMIPDRFDNVIKINLEGFVEMVRCVSLRKHFNIGMRIVGISSVAAFCGGKAHMAYAASKAALDSSVRCMAYELADKGICVNSVAPAMIATRMFEGFIEQNNETSEQYKNLMARQYLGIGETTDVANGIAFLLSDAAKFITGVCLPIDGGFTSV